MCFGGPAQTVRQNAVLLIVAATGLSLASPPAAAQASAKPYDLERKTPSSSGRDSAASRESRERSEKERRERTERERGERERSERERRERSERERRERSERARHERSQREHGAPQAPRNVPPYTSRESQPYREREHSERITPQRSRTETPGTERERASPGPYRPPSGSVVPPSTASARVSCTANPQCASATGYGNVCRNVQHTYSGSYALNDGMRDIVSRCRAANSPDPCGAGAANSTNYRLAYGGGCAQQCSGAATCTSLGAR